MDNKELIKLAYDMGAHPYRVGGMVAALQKGIEIGKAEQEAIGHSEEHLNWIIKQYHLWSYEMCHCDNTECCTFKEWIDKAKEE